jgi:hypothetical protein
VAIRWVRKIGSGVQRRWFRDHGVGWEIGTSALPAGSASKTTPSKDSGPLLLDKEVAAFADLSHFGTLVPSMQSASQEPCRSRPIWFPKYLSSFHKLRARTVVHVLTSYDAGENSLTNGPNRGRRRALDSSVLLDLSFALSGFSGDTEANAKSIGLAYV